MASRLNPYLNFRGTARDAMTFYQSVFGGELSVMTFADGGMQVAPGEEQLVMHAMLEGPAGLTLMGADVPAQLDLTPGSSISVSLSGEDEAELSGWFAALSDGATVGQPLERAPWGDTFGMLVDRFGVAWLMNISGGQA